MRKRIKVIDTTTNGCEVPVADIRADRENLAIEIDSISVRLEIPSEVVEIVMAAAESEEHG